MSNILELVPESGNSGLSCDHSKIEDVERVCGANFSYKDFFWDYMKPNKPIIITSIGNDWNCSKEWVNDGRVDIDFLATKIANKLVPVANCSKTYFNSHEKSELLVTEYCHYWNTRDESSEILYLKDWHLKATNPHYDFYSVPSYFASDWLNEYLIDTDKDDYRFVYIGPKGSWTPFHADVFSSFSWSTNIFGVKKWLLLPPGEEDKLKDSFGNDPFSIDEETLSRKDVRYFTIMQQPYESIFVPSKWYHQVWNLTDTISVNHNWFNGCNIHVIWESLNRNFTNVKKEIADCEDMENFQEHCQTMLKAVFGMNFNDFVDILAHIGRKRSNSEENLVFQQFELNSYHKTYDLLQVGDILGKIVNNEDWMSVGSIESECTKLLELIATIK